MLLFFESFLAWHFAVIAVWFFITAFCVKDNVYFVPVVLGILAYFGNAHFLDYKLDLSMFMSFKFAFLYIVIGLAWSMFKWYLYLKNRVKKSKEYEHYRNKPNISEYRDDVITWSLYWPFSMLGFLLVDMLEKIYEAMFKVFSGCYQQITNYIYKHIDEENRKEELEAIENHKKMNK